MNLEREIEVYGLDDSFDQVIRALPETLLNAPDHDFLNDDAFSEDPFTPLGHLRDNVAGIVHRGEDGLYAGVNIFNIWGHDLSKPHVVALSHAAVNEIGADKNRFVSNMAYGAQQAAHGATVNCLDGEDHKAVRRLFDTAIFGRKAMREWTEAITAPTIDYLVKRVKRMIADGETPDGRRDLALPIAYKSISTIIGVPQEDFAHFVELGETAQSGPRDMQAAMAAIAEMDQYFRDQLADRRKSPKADMISIMSEAEVDGRRLSEEEVVQHCRFLLPGGIETTWRETANLVMCMLLHPDQYAEVCANPKLVNGATEEVLRWAPSGFVVPRITAVNTEVDGVELAAGTSVCSIQGIANRDPRAFENPDDFDIHRRPNRHLTFHTGVHFCMGQNLARFIFRNMLERLAEELPDLALACDPAEVKMRGFGVRNPTTLPLTVQ